MKVSEKRTKYGSTYRAVTSQPVELLENGNIRFLALEENRFEDLVPGNVFHHELFRWHNHDFPFSPAYVKANTDGIPAADITHNCYMQDADTETSHFDGNCTVWSQVYIEAPPRKADKYSLKKDGSRPWFNKADIKNMIWQPGILLYHAGRDADRWLPGEEVIMKQVKVNKKVYEIIYRLEDYRRALYHIQDSSGVRHELWISKDTQTWFIRKMSKTGRLVGKESCPESVEFLEVKKLEELLKEIPDEMSIIYVECPNEDCQGHFHVWDDNSIGSNVDGECPKCGLDIVVRVDVLTL